MIGEPAVVRQVVQVESGYGYGVVGADLHVFQDRGPVYLLVEHQLRSDAEAGWLLEQPSRLLSARYQVVDFTGRRAEQDELAAWRDTRVPRLSVRWLHAPGGQGKTRLATEFAAQSLAAGWKVVNALHGPQTQVVPSPGSQDLRLRDERGLLLIVDYADRWPTSHLTWLFSNALLHQRLPTRCLLLARSVQPWPVIRAAVANVQAEARAQMLAPLSDDIGERERMFAAARDCFAARYGLADPAQVAPPGSLTRPEFGLVLAVHMAALVAVDALVHGVRPPEDVAGLSTYLLDREREHWERLYAGRLEGKDYGTPPSTMAHTVFTAALTGATTQERGIALLRGLDLSTHPSRLLTDHAYCYPPNDPGTVLEPIYPDRLAEDYVALTFPGRPAATEHPPAPWALPTAGALIGHDRAGARPAHLARLVTVLASAAAPGRWPHLTPHISAVLRGDPALAVVAGSAALTALADVLDLDPEVLEAVEACFPGVPEADLAPGIAAITARLIRHRLAATTDPARRVDLWMTLATRQAHAGLYDEALAANNEAVAILQSLVRVNRVRYEPVLAVVLGDRGATLLQLGRWKEAAAAERQAVKTYKRLVKADPATHEPELAAALSHLGVSLSHLGERKEALAAERRAVKICRRLADTNPQRYESDLAASLTNLGNRLAEAGHKKDALDAAEQAVQIRRRLARASSAKEEPGLARSLSNLGGRLWDLGRFEEGLEAEREAVEIFERLARANPDAYEASLARSLANLSAHLTGREQYEEALARTEQALAIRMRLAKANPAAHEVELAESRSALGLDLANLGRHEDALVASSEAVSFFRELVKANPAALEPRLAKSLGSFAQVSLLGRHDLNAANKATAEALDICLALARQNPAAFAGAFQAAWALHADILHARGRIAEAEAMRRLPHTGDPTEIRGMLFGVSPPAD